MSNVLTVSLQATIYSLHDRGWSRRRIARELGIDRETVGRYLLLAKPAISTGAEGTCEAKPAISTAGKNIGRKSQCEPLAEVIMAKVEVGLSAQRIYQDLVEENGFTDSYQSVKRTSIQNPSTAIDLVLKGTQQTWCVLSFWVAFVPET